MRIAFLSLLLLASTAFAGDPPKIDRSIGKEPKYTGKPLYCLLVFGPEAKDRVWLVRDGDTLHVDKNGNGDLTEDGEAVAKNKPKKGHEQDLPEFEVNELKIGGRTHKGLSVRLMNLADFIHNPTVRELSKGILEKDKKAPAYLISCEVEVPGMKGGGTGGRLYFGAGLYDVNGLLQFSEKPAGAPVIHFGGPLEINFQKSIPNLRIGRGTEMMLCVSTPGVGPGSTAELIYQDTIPEAAYPKAEVTFQPKKSGDAPIKELFELKERC